MKIISNKAYEQMKNNEFRLKAFEIFFDVDFSSIKATDIIQILGDKKIEEHMKAFDKGVDVGHRTGVEMIINILVDKGIMSKYKGERFRFRIFEAEEKLKIKKQKQAYKESVKNGNSVT